MTDLQKKLKEECVLNLSTDVIEEFSNNQNRNFKVKITLKILSAYTGEEILKSSDYFTISGPDVNNF